jgi:hypothetical protein
VGVGRGTGRDGTSASSFIGRGLDGARHSDLYLSTDPGEQVRTADYDFLANARQDVPRLLAEVRRLRKERRGYLPFCIAAPGSVGA